MVQLGLFLAVMVVFAVFDLRVMTREGLTRDVAAYCVVCACAALLTCIYSMEPARRSIVAFVNAALNVR